MSQAVPYIQEVMARVPALLGQLDREPLSASHGSFDREHWGWKFRDFPIVMLQAGFHPLALLWSSRITGNDYYRSRRLQEWICGGIRATLKQQHGNGAFDSVGPFTQDHGATLAMAHYLCEAARLLEGELPFELSGQMQESVARACAFALRTREDYAFISNHQALFALAWHSAANLLGDQRFQRLAEAVVARILSEQSHDGWYVEYGGPDPGYETLGIWYLAKYWQRTRDAALLDSLRRSIQFLTYCIHPNGSVGGVYGSRHTSLYFPAGFEILAEEIPQAGAVAAFMRERAASGNVVTPANSDAHNLHVLLASHMEAALSYRDRPTAAALPCERMEGLRHFPDAGITVAATRAYYAVASARKGGVCRVFDRRTHALAYEDAGYLVRAGHRNWISQVLGPGRAVLGDDRGPTESETQFALYEQPLPTPLRFIVLRILNLTLFRSPALGARIRDWIIRRLITRVPLGPLRLRRAFSFDVDAITIRDRIELSRPAEVAEVLRPRALTGIHMGSAKYFHPSDLLDVPQAPVEGMAAALNRSGKATCEFRLEFLPEGGVKLVVGATAAAGEKAPLLAAAEELVKP